MIGPADLEAWYEDAAESLRPDPSDESIRPARSPERSARAAMAPTPSLYREMAAWRRCLLGGR